MHALLLPHSLVTSEQQQTGSTSVRWPVVPVTGGEIPHILSLSSLVGPCTPLSFSPSLPSVLSGCQSHSLFQHKDKRHSHTQIQTHGNIIIFIKVKTSTDWFHFEVLKVKMDHKTEHTGSVFQLWHRRVSYGHNVEVSPGVDEPPRLLLHSWRLKESEDKVTSSY